MLLFLFSVLLAGVSYTQEYSVPWDQTRFYFHSWWTDQVCFFSSLIADGANRRATTLPIPRVVSRDLPISPRFTPTSFYRDAGSALLHLVNQWFDFSSSRPHAFRYGNHTKGALLLRLEFIDSDLVGMLYLLDHGEKAGLVWYHHHWMNREHREDHDELRTQASLHARKRHVRRITQNLSRERSEADVMYYKSCFVYKIRPTTCLITPVVVYLALGACFLLFNTNDSFSRVQRCWCCLTYE